MDARLRRDGGVSYNSLINFGFVSFVLLYEAH